ncbi:MAG: hypothetical protein V2A79_10220 [Planctomycetota bacterium]
MKIAEQEYGAWKLETRIAAALRTCLGEGMTRYSLNLVGIREEWLVTTDGRRLLVVQGAHQIGPGCHKLTQDNYLLPAGEDVKFPDWKVIIPDMDTVQELGEFTDIAAPESVASLVCRINKGADAAVRLDLLLPVMSALAAFLMPVSVYANKKNSGEMPLMLKGELAAGVEFTYLQMPVRK